MIVDDAEAILSRRMSCIGRQAIPLCRFRIVLCRTFRLAVIIAKFELGVDLTPFGGKVKPPESFDLIHCAQQGQKGL